MAPLTTEAKSGEVFHMGLVPIVELSCALRIFLRGLQFSSVSKINISRQYGPAVIATYIVVKKKCI